MRDRGGVVVEAAERLGAPLPDGARFAALLGWAEEITPPVIRIAENAYRLTAGRVGGPEDEPRSREIPAALVGRVLEAAVAGLVDWETDPDFGFETPASVPGIGPDDLLTLVPRFLYAHTDRVYDYAALVPERSEELLRIAEG